MGGASRTRHVIRCRAAAGADRASVSPQRSLVGCIAPGAARKEGEPKIRELTSNRDWGFIGGSMVDFRR
jgi:hypothetical protein